MVLAKCKCSFFSWQHVQGFFVKVSHVFSPTQVKKLCSGTCVQPPWDARQNLEKRLPAPWLNLISFLQSFFFLNHYNNAKYHAPCGHNGNLQTSFFTQNVCCRIFNRKIVKPKSFFFFSLCCTTSELIYVFFRWLSFWLQREPIIAFCMDWQYICH